MISLESAVNIIVELVVAGLIFYLLYWLVNYLIKSEPWLTIANAILAIFAVLVAIGFLLSFLHGGVPLFR